MSIQLYLLTSLLAGLLGAVLLISGIWVVNKRQAYNIWDKLYENPMALGLVVASFILGLSLVIASASF
ncbi:DUF350 domain-containing protein [Desulfonatronovibrio hydrogenovorans]|uniref:DUF350 domain-containing protein n=1 Tax=Desulfonatronovibrio hydrogenovorans TaxID=53245 RepID=UPI00048C79A5|nr:DUF350 domain-containing protein [Desulfonatronovibrio hydrogenovorans]